MLSNAYFLAKFRFDTAENEPAKNLQNFADSASTDARSLEREECRAACDPAAGCAAYEAGAARAAGAADGAPARCVIFFGPRGERDKLAARFKICTITSLHYMLSSYNTNH